MKNKLILYLSSLTLICCSNKKTTEYDFIKEIKEIQNSDLKEIIFVDDRISIIMQNNKFVDVKFSINNSEAHFSFDTIWDGPDKIKEVTPSFNVYSSDGRYTQTYWDTNMNLDYIFHNIQADTIWTNLENKEWSFICRIGNLLIFTPNKLLYTQLLYGDSIIETKYDTLGNIWKRRARLKGSYWDD